MVFNWQRKRGIPFTEYNRFWDSDKAESRFVRDLLETKGCDEDVVDRRVKYVLRALRIRRTIQPWLDIIKPIITPLDTFYETVREFLRRDEVDNTLTGVTIAVPSYQNWSMPASVFPPPPNQPQSVVQAPKPVFEDAGIKTGEVTAWRAWVLCEDGLLHSCFVDEFAWAPGIPAEGDPNDICAGIHAFKEKEQAKKYIGSAEGFVIGTVHLYGTVYEHTDGYRASHAMIASIEDAPSIALPNIVDAAGNIVTGRSGPTYDAAALRKKYKLDDPATEIPE